MGVACGQQGGEEFPKRPNGIPKQIGYQQSEYAPFNFGGIFFVVVAVEKGDCRQHKKHGDGKLRNRTGEEVRHLVVCNRNKLAAHNVRSEIGMNEENENAQQKGNKLFLFAEKRIMVQRHIRTPTEEFVPKSGQSIIS